MSGKRKLCLGLLSLLYAFQVNAFFSSTGRKWKGTVSVSNQRALLFPKRSRPEFGVSKSTCLAANLGEFELELSKPLGMILEEREGGANGGVRIKEIGPDGSAASSRVVPGDVLQQVEGQSVATAGFDTVMDLLIEAPAEKVQLVVSDGLGVLDMPKNVVNTLKSTEDAYFVDAVVREAAREIRRNGRLGDLLQVEVVVGAGVQENGSRAKVRFFAILSTDGVSTYSCNVAATGVRDSDTNEIKIVSLSCAKDEGLGQTFDLVQEDSIE